MDGREFAVRCKAEIRSLYFAEIIAHAFPVSLLVQAQYETDFLSRIRFRFLKSLHGIESRDHGAFVIDGSAAIEFSVFDLPAEGLMIPVVSLRDHVKMAYDAHALIGYSDYITVFIEDLSSELDVSAVIIRVADFEIFIFCFFQHIGKCLMDVFSKRHIIYWFGYYAGDGDKLLKSLYHLIPVRLDPFIDFFPLVHGMLLVYCFHAFDLRIAFLQHLLNDTFQCHDSTRASCAVSLKLNFYDIIVCVFNKLDISAVSLKDRSYLIKTSLDFLFHFLKTSFHLF